MFTTERGGNPWLRRSSSRSTTTAPAPANTTSGSAARAATTAARRSTALRPGGRFFLVDSLRDPTSTAVDHQLPALAATTLTRRLNDGREFEIYKVFYAPEDLERRLRDLGWHATVSGTEHYFLYAQGE